MGDKGGKKDKAKSKQQQLTKQKHEEREAGQSPSKDSVARRSRRTVGTSKGHGAWCVDTELEPRCPARAPGSV